MLEAIPQINNGVLQGFFVPYLTGGISIVVLALGSTAPGLLGFFINKFSAVFPDYRERVLGHEAAHFLVRPTLLHTLIQILRC